MTPLTTDVTLKSSFGRLRRLEHFLYILRAMLAGLAWLGLEAVNFLPGIRVGLDSLNIPHLGIVALSGPPFGLATTIIWMATNRGLGTKSQVGTIKLVSGRAEHSESIGIAERAKTSQAAQAKAAERLRTAETRLTALPTPGFWARLFGTKTHSDYEEAQSQVWLLRQQLADLQLSSGLADQADLEVLSRHNQKHLTWMGYLAVILAAEGAFYFTALVTPGFLRGAHETITVGVIGRSVEDHPISWLIGLGVVAVAAIGLAFFVENERAANFLGIVGLLSLLAGVVLGVVAMVRIGWFHWLTISIGWLATHTAPDTPGWTVAILVTLTIAFVAFLARHLTRAAGVIVAAMSVAAVALIIWLIVSIQ